MGRMIDALRARLDVWRMGTENVLLFRYDPRTGTTWQVGDIWKDNYGRDWKVTHTGIEPDGRIGVYGSKREMYGL